MYKVLLVDDEILVREAISTKVEWNKLGFELAGDCENGRDAIEFLAANPVDVVLTDICMPHVDGMQVSKYIYENCPQTVIIIFSGYSDFDYAKQAIQYKVSEYILKPVTKQELSDVLSRIREKLDSERQQEQKMDELTKVYRTYTKNEALIVSRTLSRLVRGTQEVATSVRELEEFGITVEGMAYRVVVVDIDVYSELYEIDDELKKESALMSFVVENIANEIVSSNEAGLTYRDTDNRVCILLYANRQKALEHIVGKVCEDIKEQVHQAMKLSISMGIGILVKNLEGLSKSYDSAVEVLRYRYTTGSGVVFDCEQQMPVANSMELEADLKDLVLALTGRDAVFLKQTLKHIEEWMRSKCVSRNKAAAYLHQMLRVIMENVQKTNEEFTLSEVVVSGVTEARSLEKAMGHVYSYGMKGLQSLEAASQTSSERLAVMTMDYLEQNFSNQDMSLNQVCEYLNISTSRFSSSFKEATGKTFTEALINIRMERAKQLLCNTSLKNYEIAEKVGFSDPHYFNISFKKMTGKTPKEYAREK